MICPDCNGHPLGRVRPVCQTCKGTSDCGHEYGVTGGTIYCVHCKAEWDLLDVMATNPPPRERHAP